MKRVVFYLLLSVLLLPPLASFAEEIEEVKDDKYSSAAIETAVSAGAEKKPAEAATEKAAPEGNGEQATLAKANLDFLRKECAFVLSSEGSGGLFGGAKYKETAETLLGELDRYIRRYGDLPMAGEALLLKGNLHKYLKEYEAALLSYYKLVYEYPESSFKNKAENGIKELFKDKLKKDWREDLELAKGPSGGIDKADRLAQYTERIAALERSDFRPLQRNAFDEFLFRFPENPRADAVLLLEAESLIKDKQYESAAYSLKKLSELYTTSALRPKSLFLQGGILERELKDCPRAVAAYQCVIKEHPESEETKLSLERSARLYFEKLKNPSAAIGNIEELVRKYPTEEAALRGLQFEAEIYQSQKQYREAVETYRRIANMFPNDPAVSALALAAATAAKSLKDYPLQLELEERLIKEYPDREESIDAMLDMAETYEKKLKDTGKAIEVYKNLAITFPNHENSEKARNRLKALEK